MTTAAFHFDTGASLAKYQATAAEVVPLVLDSVDGVRTVTWSVVSTDETSAGQWTITNPTSIAGATLTAPGSGTAKACIVECVVNNGSETDPRTGRQVEGDLRKRAKAHVGVEVACVGEVNESDPAFGWVPLVNTSIRLGGGVVNGEVDPIPETIPERTTAGALLATSFQGDATGAADTVLARSGDTRIVLTGSGVIALQRWSGAAWQNKNRFISRANGTLGVQSDGAGGFGIWTDADRHSTAAEPDEVVLSAEGPRLYATDSDGRVVALNRAEPSLHSSGSVTLVPDGVYILSGTATAGALPEASGWVGIRITVVNRTAGALSIARSGSDTIDGATSYSLPAGAAVTFMASASGSIAVQSDAGVSGGGSSDEILVAADTRVKVAGSGVVEVGRWITETSEWSTAMRLLPSATGEQTIRSTGALALSVGGTPIKATLSDASGTYSVATDAPMRIQPTQATSGAGRALSVVAGQAESGVGGNATIQGGDAAGTNQAGGDVVLRPGLRTGSGAASTVTITDEAGTGRLFVNWNSATSAVNILTAKGAGNGIALSGSSMFIGGETMPIAVGPSVSGTYTFRGSQFLRQRITTTYETVELNGVAIASATTTNVVTFATTANRVYQVIGHITVSNDTDDEGAVYWVRAAFKRVGGTVTQIGATQTVAADLEDAGQAGLAAVLDFSGTDIRLRLTTDSADSVTANGMLQVYERVLA
jgi:hypothetical protein